jgi:uncharacterized membrane protein (Fun14 family)
MAMNIMAMDEERVRWGGIVSGLAVGFAVQMALTLLGLAIGTLSLDLRDADTSKAISLGTAMWTALSMLVSAFTGGYIAARVSRSSMQSDAMFQGTVLWGITWVLSAFLATTAAAALLGVFSAFGPGLRTPSVNVANLTIHRMGTAASWLFALAVLTLGMTMFGGRVGARSEEKFPAHDDDIPLQRKAV